VPDVEDYAPPSVRAFGTPTVDVGPLYVPTTAYIVHGLTQEDRRALDGRIIPTIAVLFEVPGRPGQFTIRIDNYAFTHADPLLYMRERAYLIRSLYELPNVSPPYKDVPAVSIG
jgi:hypothetical protein